MSETERIETTGDGLVIDKSKQYKTNVGQCAQCGHYKTWEFKVVNSKTGKGMPGHVTKEGFKIGDGNCPYWNKIAAMNAVKAEKKGTSKPLPAGQWINEIAGNPQAKMQNVVDAAAPKQVETKQAPASSEGITITVGAMKLVLNPQEALRVAKDILDQLAM